MSTNFDCDVLVIGAGPTGLMMANCLARAGVDVRVVEKRPEPSTESRAFAMQARTVELFASLGLDGSILDEGVMNTNIDFFVGGEPVGGLRFDQVDSPDAPFHFILMIPQSRTERVLIDGLSGSGVEVDRGLEIVDLAQDDTGVTATGRRTGVGRTAIRARYLFAGDGPHSVTRHTLGLSFEGAKYAQSFLLADVRVDWALDHDRFRVFMHGDRIALFLPLNGKALSRVMTTDLAPSGERGSHEHGSGGNGPGEHSDVAETSPLDLAELQPAFAAATNLPVTLADPVWITRYRTHHRRVDRYRVDRIFVGGDAAHIHSPAGGQGMNTGLQDAANLAWKLAAVLRGADEALLDTYQSERLPVAEAVLHYTDALFQEAAGQNGWKAKLRDVLAPVLVRGASRLDFVQDTAFRKLSEIDVGYAPGTAAVAATEPAAEASGPTPGKRAPDARINRRDRVFDLLGGYRFHVLALSRQPLGTDEASALRASLDAFEETSAVPVSAHLVARLSVGRQAGVVPVETSEVFDHYAVGEGARALVLVRPDGYVAWHGEGIEVERCAGVLRRFGGRGAADTLRPDASGVAS